MIGGSNPGRDWEFFSSSPRPDWPWGPHRLYPMGTRDSFPEGKASEADHSLPSTAEVKEYGSYTSTPPISLHDVMLSSKKFKNVTSRDHIMICPPPLPQIQPVSTIATPSTGSPVGVMYGGYL
jgi:hypothetical protein